MRLRAPELKGPAPGRPPDHLGVRMPEVQPGRSDRLGWGDFLTTTVAKGPNFSKPQVPHL